MKKNVLLLGSYGMYNLGDEELLRVFVDKIKPKVNKLVVNSSNPKYTEKNFGVPSFSTGILKDPIKKFRIFWESDIYVFGGGSVLIEHSKRNLRWYHIPARPLYLCLFITIIGKLLKKKIIFSSIGIGPIESRHGRFITRVVLNLADEIIVRDRNSYVLAKKLVQRDVTLSSDAVLINRVINKEKQEKSVIIFPSYHLPVSENEKIKITSELVKFINLCGNLGYKVALVPLWYDFTFITDTWYAERLIALGANAEISICKTFQEISQRHLKSASNCLSMRLHGAVFAALHKTPFLALNYNPKVKGFVDEINKNYLVELEEFNAKLLMRRFERLSFGKKERRNLEALKQKAEITFKILNSHLK